MPSILSTSIFLNLSHMRVPPKVAFFRCHPPFGGSAKASGLVLLPGSPRQKTWAEVLSILFALAQGRSYLYSDRMLSYFCNQATTSGAILKTDSASESFMKDGRPSGYLVCISFCYCWPIQLYTGCSEGGNKVLIMALYWDYQLTYYQCYYEWKEVMCGTRVSGFLSVVVYFKLRISVSPALI